MMIRPFTLFCAFFAGVSGMVLYAQKHKTTQLDKQITKIVYDTQRIKSRTAMLRTEWTLLNQPDRLKDLSANFIPGLRPLNPTQFVQMSAVTNVLPPIQQDQGKDKTREQLVQNVAQNHGQSATNVADINNDSSNNHKEPPIIVAQNGDTVLPSDVSQQQKSQIIPPAVTNAANSTTDSVASSLPETYKKTKDKEVADSTNTVETSAIKPQPIKKPVTTTAQNNSDVATVIPVRRKKIKTTEVADSTNTVEAPTTKPQPIKKPTTTTAQNNNDVAAVVPTHRKKVKTTEVADATDAIETPIVKPQPIKKNHIENVSYNIQSGNPFSHNKTSRSKTSSSDQDNATNIVEKKNIKQTQQASAIIPKKRPAAIKVARYEAKKSTFSESALGGNSNDTLPAPVPFAP